MLDVSWEVAEEVARAEELGTVVARTVDRFPFH
jgi:hypothetical protein